MKELRKMVGGRDKICLTIVGNKLDLERQGRSVEADEAEKYAKSVGASFFEVSARTGSGVEKMFVELTRELLDTVKPSHKASRSTLANASSSMAGAINRSDERIDLSQKLLPDAEQPRCC